MPDHDRNNGNITDNKGLKIDSIQFEVWNTGIFFVCKGIGKLTHQSIYSHLIGINLHRLFLEKIKSPNIIQACYVILMRLCEQYRIQVFYTFPEHLVPEVRRGINN